MQWLAAVVVIVLVRAVCDIGRNDVFGSNTILPCCSADLRRISIDTLIC